MARMISWRRSVELSLDHRPRRHELMSGAWRRLGRGAKLSPRSPHRGDRRAWPSPSIGRRSIAVVGIAALAYALVACAPPPSPKGLGRRVSSDSVSVLRASADGTALALLRACEPVKDRTLPPGTALCALAILPVGGGSPQRVAERVTTLPQGFAWSATGHALAALGDYDYAAGRGALTLWTAGSEARPLAAGVTFYAFDRAGANVGWIAEGRLAVAPVAQNPSASVIEGASGVATFEFGEGAFLLARREAQHGGELLAVRDRAVKAVASGVRDYAFARSGKHFAFTSGSAQGLSVASAPAAAPTPPWGRDVHEFLFSPKEDGVAFVADARPGVQGNLWWASTAGGAPLRMAQRVGMPRWSARGDRLAWLDGYDPRARTGALTTGAPGSAPIVLARHVSDFDLSPDGATAAFLVHETAGGYSVDLGLARSSGGAVEKIARGVFGFSFSPDSRWLYYRTACTREAEACDLYRVPATGLVVGSKPERIAEGVKSYEFAPGRPGRLLIGWSRMDRVALDLAFWEDGKLTAIDTYALPGSAQFLGGDPTRLAYAVVEAKRQGVYVAEMR